MNQDQKILAFVGMPGSGKSSAVEYLLSKGYQRVYFGGVVLDEVKKRGLEINPDNEKMVREGLRETEGKDFIVKRIISQINELIANGEQRVIADGIYSWTEYKTMYQEFGEQLITVAIVTPRKLRYKRLSERPERPLTLEEVSSRDYAEIENIEKGGPIAIADYYILNDQDIDQLHRDVDNILNTVKF